jgi:tetratricopeptide (TPR) repeat protein
LTERQEEIARFRFDRPSIFGKVCARALAERRRVARLDVQRGAFLRAREGFEAILGDDPDHLATRLEYAGLLGRMELFSEALEIASERPETGLARVQQAQFLELEGDLQWRQGDTAQARRAYVEALELGVPVATERNLEMKRRLVGRTDTVGRELMVEQTDLTRTMYLLLRWRQDEPESREAAYLLGRRLWQGHHYEEAIPHLRRAAGSMDSDVLDGEAWLMLGHSYFFVGRWADSSVIWRTLSESEVTRYREVAASWEERLRWAVGSEE